MPAPVAVVCRERLPFRRSRAAICRSPWLFGSVSAFMLACRRRTIFTLARPCPTRLSSKLFWAMSIPSRSL
ncbi:hypothetical protein H696_02709 [Fonticula alba]|uniref:Uncharacterized protein n=1 Tax=Fonticula alba TaxID=691883 RepID=A0A058Z7X0_FONAL|nr:hypothetical protein H696_02709 [Fonticula alba]KCV70375.1 hypothetical protein H696_02709 [Fonticula alba]|eukprot:XP_009494891.1 hypothetical protein H696_02709 [Fonticula alba]